MRTKNVHDWNRSRNGLEREERRHSNHGGPSVLHFNLLVTCILFVGHALLQTKVVEVQVTRGLGGLSSEVIAGVANTFSLSDGDENKDVSEPDWLLRGEGAKSLCPVRLLWESREVQTKTDRILE